MISPVTIGFIAIIVSSAYGMVINCDYKIESFSLGTVGSTYTCKVTRMSSENPTIVEAIRGNHAEGMNNSDVRGYLSLSCAYLSYCPKSLPKNIGNFFPNLVAFYYYYSFLETISADTLKSMPNLISLELPVNSLTSLDSDLFQYTPNMIYIDLFSNHIQHVGKDIFVGMDELMAVRLMNNTCIDTQLWTISEQNRKEANEQLLLACPPLTVTSAPTTSAPSTSAPSTSAPSTSEPTTSAPTTSAPTTSAPTTSAPTTSAPSTLAPTTSVLTTSAPTTPIQEQCLASCLLNEEVDEVKVQVGKLSLLNLKLDERSSCQHQRIAALEKELGIFD